MLEAYQQNSHLVSICTDGYIRLTPEQFEALRFEHLLSGIEHDPSSLQNECGASTTIFGYTEWISSTSPVISLGWDWNLHGQNRKAYCVHSGDVRSNVMFVDNHEKDLGLEQTNLLLERWLSSFDWSPRVLDSL